MISTTTNDLNKKFDHHAMHHSLYRMEDDTLIIFSVLSDGEGEVVRITKYENARRGDTNLAKAIHTFYDKDRDHARDLWNALVKVGYSR